MRSRLLKVEATGNDFVLGTGTWAERLAGEPELAVRLCDRRRGIGGDGVLALWRESNRRARLAHRNSDGTAAAFCGNGTRCAARAAVALLGCCANLDVVTGWSVIPATVDGTVVRLRLPAVAETPRRLLLATAAGPVEGFFVRVGVPHLVIPVADPGAVDLAATAPALRHHPELGPEGANVSFVAAAGQEPLAVRTWERGVEGETLACGSGVVAAALVMMGRRGSHRLRLLPAAEDELVVVAVGEPPLCPVELSGATRIVAEITPTPELLD